MESKFSTPAISTLVKGKNIAAKTTFSVLAPLSTVTTVERSSFDAGPYLRAREAKGALLKIVSSELVLDSYVEHCVKVIEQALPVLQRDFTSAKTRRQILYVFGKVRSVRVCILAYSRSVRNLISKSRIERLTYKHRLHLT